MRRFESNGLEMEIPDELDLIEGELPSLYLKSGENDIRCIIVTAYSGEEAFVARSRDILWTRVPENHPLIDSTIHFKEEVSRPFQGAVCIRNHLNRRTQVNVFEYKAEFLVGENRYIEVVIKDEGGYEELHEKWLSVVTSIKVDESIECLEWE